MHIHDTHRLALLVVAFGGKGEPEPSREDEQRESGKPGQHAIRQRQEPGRVGEIAEFAYGQAAFTHDGSLTRKAGFRNSS